MGPSGGAFHGHWGWGGVGPPEWSADLRRYYAKHTKNDRLDSHVLARLPLLHPDGLNLVDSLGPADALKRAVRRRVKLVEYRLASRQRLDSMLGRGYFTIIRLYGPDQPYFDETWKPSDLAPIS